MCNLSGLSRKFGFPDSPENPLALAYFMVIRPDFQELSHALTQRVAAVYGSRQCYWSRGLPARLATLDAF